MSRTNLDAETLARSLRTMAGDGSMEWVYEPIQRSVLLDVADMLDDNIKLHKLCTDMLRGVAHACMEQTAPHEVLREFSDRMRELGLEAS